jgi:hypothetical protein
MGVGLEQDSRNVVADDLDGDGRMDLLVTTFEVWPEVKQTLRVFKNTLDDAGNWIGFRLREQGGGISPVGARITVRYPGGAMIRQSVTGDSYRSQHANTLHFGLGEIAKVESAEIRWMNGRNLTLRQPRINQYHVVQPGEPLKPKDAVEITRDRRHGPNRAQLLSIMEERSGRRVGFLDCPLS